MSGDAYHHGDLRNALLDEAASLIAESGMQALSLRKLGDRLGVSRSALYRHFLDKSALLAAVAEQGFVDLQERLASIGDGGAAERLHAMGTAYVGFAVERPAHYRVMFSSTLERGAHPGLASAAAAAFGELQTAVQQGQARGTLRPGSPQELAYSAWALVHGLAMLAIDRQIDAELETDVLARTATGHLVDGLAAPEGRLR